MTIREIMTLWRVSDLDKWAAGHQHLFGGRPLPGCGNSQQLALSLPFEGKAGVVHEGDRESRG